MRRVSSAVGIATVLMLNALNATAQENPPAAQTPAAAQTPPTERTPAPGQTPPTERTPAATTAGASDPWQAPRDYWASLPLLVSAHGSLGVMTFGSISSVSAGLTTTISGLDSATRDTSLQPFVRAGSIRSRAGSFRVDFLGEQFATTRPLYELDQRPEPVTTPRTALSLENSQATSVGFRATISGVTYLLFAPQPDGNAQASAGEVFDVNADAIRSVSIDGSSELVMTTSPNARVRRDLTPYYSGCLSRWRRPRRTTGEVSQAALALGSTTPLERYAIRFRELEDVRDRLRNLPGGVRAIAARLADATASSDANVTALRNALSAAITAYFDAQELEKEGDHWEYCQALIGTRPTGEASPAAQAVPYDRLQVMFGARYVSPTNNLNPAGIGWEAGISYRNRRFGGFVSGSGYHLLAQDDVVAGNQRSVRPNYHEVRLSAGMQFGTSNFLGDGSAVVGLQASWSHIFWDTPVDVPGRVTNGLLYGNQIEVTLFASLPARAVNVFQGLVGIGFKIPYQPVDGGAIGFIPTLTIIPAAATPIAQRH